ncbi:recombinase family protein [Mycobacterium avium]|uniref:recombinase family protein n=1 Tax=Mycobacterium avium TaxID=1764 RepID=UPI00111C457C|nr:recombinase family protein [Mycobacterium avium]
MGELLGYARVSTSDQNLDSQADALTTAGCGRVWTDVASGVRAHRPALGELVAAAGAGDTVVVCRLDRLGRSLPDLLTLVEDLARRDVGLRSLAEQIDTTSATVRPWDTSVFAIKGPFDVTPDDLVQMQRLWNRIE